jgi:hypothetical protein
VKTDLPDVDPPLYHAQPGRPRKKRIRGQGESQVAARASKKSAIRCSNCKAYGHNVKGCGQPIRPDWEPRAGAKFTRVSISSNNKSYSNYELNIVYHLYQGLLNLMAPS